VALVRLQVEARPHFVDHRSPSFSGCRGLLLSVSGYAEAGATLSRPLSDDPCAEQESLPPARRRLALPALCDEAKASRCARERVADGGRVPAGAALCGGDAIGVQSVRDRGQALASCSLAPDALERVRGHRRRASEPDALRALGSKRAPDALRVKPSLVR